MPTACATRAGRALRRDQITFPRSSHPQDLVSGLARDSCFFGTNQPLRWVRTEPAMTESELCELLACHGSTTGVSWPNRPCSTPPPEPSATLAGGGERVSVQNAREDGAGPLSEC